MSAETITITVAEYEELLDAQLKLTHLEGAGVDNWDGYDYAMEAYWEEKGEE
jgi:hypothetical protein